MLIFAPATKQQCNGLSIHATIRDRIDAAFSGDIAFLFDSAMQVRRLKQNSSSTYINPHGSAQLAADNDDFRTAVARACASQSIATIDPQNILHVEKLYTQPVPPLGHPPPSSCTPHQSYCLPGDICDTIRHAAKNKGAGINADSIDIFTSLLKRPHPSTEDDIRFVFNLIYQNNLPESVKYYFTDVFLFCLHKDPNDHTKLRPLGIPTAIRRLIGTHVAKVTDRCHQRTSPLQRKSSRAEYDDRIFSPCPIEVEGIQGAGPQIGFCGAVSPKSPDHGDHPPPTPPLP